MVQRLPRPSEAELEILTILWARGPSTVRDVHEEFTRSRKVGYTSVLKLLQIMTEKGLVRRQKVGRSHVYAARLTETQGLGRLARDVLKRAFGGSAARLVLHALSKKPATPEELAQLRKILEEIDRREPQ